MRRGGAIAVGMVVGWYALALALLHPLANGPVADSWIYDEAVRWFRATGEIRFPGFTETMPVAQVIYGAGWGSIFGTSAVSLDLANAFLGIVAALLMYALAIRCGTRPWQALAAAGLLVCNPCYLFLSFSFMSEIAFLTALLGSHLAFANAECERQGPYLWLSASLAVVAFAVRPFGGAAILRIDRCHPNLRYKATDSLAHEYHSDRIQADAVCICGLGMRVDLDLAHGREAATMEACPA